MDPGLWEGKEVGLRRAGKRQEELLGETGEMVGMAQTGTEDTSAGSVRAGRDDAWMWVQNLLCRDLPCP